MLAYSPTMVNQQWPHSTALRGGAWEYHSPWPGPANPLLNANGFNLPTPSTLTFGSPLIPVSDTKPIRFWYEVGDHDLWYPNPLDDGMHDWVLANETMAKVLAAKNYQYQFIFSRNAGHVDFPTLTHTLGQALQWVWQGFQRRDQTTTKRAAAGSSRGLRCAMPCVAKASSSVATQKAESMLIDTQCGKTPGSFPAIESDAYVDRQ